MMLSPVAHSGAYPAECCVTGADFLRPGFENRNLLEALPLASYWFVGVGAGAGVAASLGVLK